MAPENRFAAQVGGGTTLCLATRLGYAVSTTRVIAGSVLAAGATRRLSAVRWGVARSMVVVGLLTIPATAFVAAALYRPVQGIFWPASLP
jgi:inorganic phosphate transporter, PiT family